MTNTFKITNKFNMIGKMHMINGGAIKVVAHNIYAIIIIKKYIDIYICFQTTKKKNTKNLINFGFLFN